MKQLRILCSPQATKAWLAAFGALIAALLMGNQDNVLDLNDWLRAGGSFIGALGVVFAVPNARPSEEVSGEREDGHDS